MDQYHGGSFTTKTPWLYPFPDVMSSPGPAIVHQPETSEFVPLELKECNLDRSFLACIKEIERCYIDLPKYLRLRVEKWVEKLFTVSGNKQWKKHRNSYAKILLSQIIKKSLSEPFHTSPPDGPLPSFPTYLQASFKDSLGAHESSYWRSIYERVENASFHKGKGGREKEYGQQQTSTIETSFQRQSSSNIINNSSSNIINNSSSSSSSSSSSMNNSNSRINMSKYNSNSGGEDLNVTDSSPSRELHHLRSLIQRQASQIQLLEQQLQEERTVFEIEIQRLRYAHKLQLESLGGLSDGLSVSNANTNMNTSTNINTNANANAATFPSFVPSSIPSTSIPSSSIPSTSIPQPPGSPHVGAFSSPSSYYAYSAVPGSSSSSSRANVVNASLTSNQEAYFAYLSKFQKELKQPPSLV